MKSKIKAWRQHLQSAALLIVLIGNGITPKLQAAAPNILAFEGRIAVSGQTFSGTGLFKFALVNSNGSQTYWSNDGTSAAGGEPASHVSIPVSGGLYSVLLGSGMQEVPPSVFKENSDVKLRIWFNDGVNGFHQLSPDQQIASVGYAMGVPAGSVSSSELAEGSITAEKLADLTSNPDSAIMHMEITDLSHDVGLNGLIIHQGHEFAEFNLMRSDSAEQEGDHGNFTVFESQTWDSNGNGLTNLELQRADVHPGDSFFALSAESDYGSDGDIDMELCNREAGLSGKLYHLRGDDENQKTLAHYRLFPMNDGIPQYFLSQFIMREELWGSKAMADWTVFSSDPDWTNWQTHGAISFFPQQGSGQDGRHAVMNIYLEQSRWTTERALEVHGDVIIHNDLQVTHGVNNPGGTFNIFDDAYVSGDLHVNGFLSKSGGGFRIDHPLDPEHKTLTHSFVESPDMKNLYDGLVTTGADGRATIELPSYFEALNKDFRYQLTVVDAEFARVRVSRKIENNRFEIATDMPGIEVSWQVTGIRKDAWAEANRPAVEAPRQTNP